MRLKAWRESEYFLFDVLAAALGVGLFVLFYATVNRGVGVPDECFFFSVAYRVALGDRMIADEWNVAQLVHFFNLFPTHLFLKLTGGTEGIVLFVRHLFLAAHAICYGFIYTKLRRFKGWGVAATLLYCAVIAQTQFTFYYFTIAPMALLAVWLILTDDRKPRSIPGLLLAGFLMACAILSEPFLMIVYVMWFVLTLVRELRKKKVGSLYADYDFILTRRIFFWMSVGAAALFFFYMAFMVFGGSFKGVGDALAYILGGEEYNTGNLIDFQKIKNAIGLFGTPCIIGSVLSLLAAVVYRIKKQDDTRIKWIIFTSAFVFLAAGYVYAAFKTVVRSQWLDYYQYNNFSLMLFSPIPWLLCKKKTPRLFVLWLIGMLFSVLSDVASDVILGSGGGIVRTACVLQLSYLLAEMKTETVPARVAKRGGQRKKNGKQREKKAIEPVMKRIVCACVAVVLMWNLGHVYGETMHKPFESMLTNNHLVLKLDKGPFKGLRTNETVAAAYEDMLTDLDTIRKLDTERAPVAVIGLLPFTYLYMGLPFGAYSAWYEYDEPERLAAYWQLRPQHIPAIIYVPYIDGFSYQRNHDKVMETRMNGIWELVSGEITEGAAGYIITGVSLKEK